MEQTGERQSGGESKTQLVEQIKAVLRAGGYTRALDLLRTADAEFPGDAEIAELEKRAHDGAKHKAEADRLITESRELFALQKSAEAIQLLRKAHELDKQNPLARSILANALVEHANSLVETDWLEAEKLSNQALALNPAHPTAKTILNLIVQKKETSPVDDWVSQARKLHDSGDLFAALAWVAEGLAVHPHDAKLLQVQDAVQRDQEARRRQARRGDVEELRRLQQEIAGASDAAAKQALVERIQAIAAKHWTDGEILSIANALLLRLGLVPQESGAGSTRRKGGTVIFHVPRPNAPETVRAEAIHGAATKDPVSSAAPSVAVAAAVPPEPVPASTLLASAAAASNAAPSTVTPKVVTPGKIAPNKRKVVAAKVASSNIPPAKVVTLAPEPPPIAPPATIVPAVEASAPARVTPSQPKQAARSNSAMLIAVSAVAGIILIAAIVFFARQHQASPVAKTPASVPTAARNEAPAATVATPTPSTPAVAAPAQSAPTQPTPEVTSPAPSAPSEVISDKVTPEIQAPAQSAGSNVGTLLVVVGQDGATVSLNGKVQRQLTRTGQLRLPNLESRDYVVQISKSGFLNPAQQTVRVRKGEQANVTFSLQPQPPAMASLAIQGGAPGTTVFVDQALVGTIQSDGSLSVSAVAPGDHTIELRKDRFKPRQLKKHFVAGAAISLAAADAALEAAPGQLKITFTPADANVAIVKGDLLKMVSSGAPLSLAPGTYTLTARTSDRFTRSATVEVVAGQSKAVDLSLAPNGMSKWEDAAAWKHEGDSFSHKGGEFVLYGAVPTSGTFVFSATLAKGHMLQWVLNYGDAKNYVLYQMDDNYFYRTVFRNGQKASEIRISDKGDKKNSHTIHIGVSATEIVHQVKHGDSWAIVDRWSQPGANLGQGKFGFYIPGSDQVELSGFAHYADLNIR